MYFGDLILGFLARGDSGEEGGVAGFWMMGSGVICAVFGDLCSVMVVGVTICSVFAGSDVSFSGVFGCRRAVGGGLVVSGGGRLAPVDWRGHSSAEGAGCLQLSALFL